MLLCEVALGNSKESTGYSHLEEDMMQPDAKSFQSRKVMGQLTPDPRYAIINAAGKFSSRCTTPIIFFSRCPNATRLSDYEYITGCLVLFTLQRVHRLWWIASINSVSRSISSLDPSFLSPVQNDSVCFCLCLCLCGVLLLSFIEMKNKVF